MLYLKFSMDSFIYIHSFIFTQILSIKYFIDNNTSSILHHFITIFVLNLLSLEIEFLF